MRALFLIFILLLAACSSIDSVQVFDDQQAAVLVKRSFIPASCHPERSEGSPSKSPL